MSVLFQQVSVKNVLQTVYDCFISTGFSKECFTDWKTFLHLSIPGMFMLCLEWWCFEILVFLCGKYTYWLKVLKFVDPSMK
jgi:Na+-driven multidrug efflux pump